MKQGMVLQLFRAVASSFDLWATVEKLDTKRFGTLHTSFLLEDLIIVSLEESSLNIEYSAAETVLGMLSLLWHLLEFF